MSSAPQFSAPKGSVDITANRVELSNTPSSQAKPIATAGKTVRITSTVDVLELYGDINAGTTASPGSITLQSAKEISWSCANSTGNLTATAADGYFEMWPVGGGSAATLHGSAVLTAHNSVDMRNVNVTGNVRVPGASSVDITNTVTKTPAIGGTADLNATYNVVVSATESEKEIGKETGNSLVSDKGAIIRRNSKGDTATVGGKSYPFQASDLCMEDGKNWPTVPTLFREDTGYALWEPVASGGTLTLCCAVLHGGNGPALVLPDGPITIVLAGDTASSLLTTGKASASDVAVHNKGDLTITGSGELHAETIDASASGCAIRLNNGNLKISGNVVVGILSGMKVKSGDDASACGIYANGNVSIEGAAKVNAQMSPTSIRSTGAVSVASTGSGYVFAPTVEAKSFSNTGSGYQNGIVTTEKDIEFFGLSALQQNTTYNKKVIVESGASLTITGGSTLTLADTADTADTLDNRGSVINNGVIVFPKSYTTDQIKALHLQGIGTVKIGTDGKELSNAGAARKILADTSIVYTGKAGDGYTTTVSGNTVKLVLDDGVTVTASGASALGNGDTSKYVKLPAGKDVEISAKGTASIQGGIDTNGATSLTCTGGTLNVGGSIVDLTAAKITVSGGTVHVFETLTAYNSQTSAESTVSVTGGAKLICELGITAATRANDTMTGTITVDGKGTELNAAVYTNALKLINGAKVTAKGQSAAWGVQTFGPVSVTGGSTLNASGSTALYMGGKLTVDKTSTLNAAGSSCALLISTSHGETAADLLAVANLPAGLQLKHSAPDSVQGGVNWSLFPSNVTEPVSRSDFESSAVKTLNIAASDDSGKDSGGGSGGSGGSGSGGGSGASADSGKTSDKTSTDTKTNADGSTTKTEKTTKTDSTGAVTTTEVKTTTGTDGKTTKVETDVSKKTDKVTGAVTETTTQKTTDAAGKTEVVEQAKTTVTDKTTGAKTEIVAEAKTTADGTTTKVETVKVAGGKDGVTAEAKVETAKTGEAVATATIEAPATATTTTLPAAVVEAVTKADTANVTVKVGEVSVALDKTAVEAVKATGGEAPVISATPVAAKSLPSDLQSATKAYDFKVSGKGVNFGGGSAVVSVPYTKADPAKAIAVYHIDANGNKTRVYDAKLTAGTLNIPTVGWSTYAVLEVAPLAFTDVKDTDWFYGSVQYAVDNNLFKGTSATTFGPNVTMTRGMLVTVLWRMAGSPAMDDYGYPYEDVDARLNGFAPAIYWARDQKLVNGYSDDKFGPDDAVTREQMVSILYRYAALKKYSVSGASELTAFTDAANVSSYATAAVKWAVGAKLLTGSDGKLNPASGATRAEVAAILMRFGQSLAKSK